MHALITKTNLGVRERTFEKIVTISEFKAWEKG